MDFTALQVDLARRSKWNIGYFVAGFLFWLFVLVSYQYFNPEILPTVWLVGTFFIFPLAVLASKLLNADPFTKDNRLGELVGYTHMSVNTMSFPIILVIYFKYPDALLLCMAIIYCIDFYVMSWAFGSAIFGISAAIRVAGVSAAWLFFPDIRQLLVMIIALLSYGILLCLIPIRRSVWLTNIAKGQSR